MKKQSHLEEMMRRYSMQNKIINKNDSYCTMLNTSKKVSQKSLKFCSESRSSFSLSVSSSECMFTLIGAVLRATVTDALAVLLVVKEIE
ncbi:hypothetical protein T05_1741 [Trichinella murrelli]|uniref:Uncharacterized protein n=1 Tax=Trichinella murrelli TaxID=144512 RepID=A0A0V0TR49_9BILA|nr:hypothetical protein T05_1741 [Trichinella murrelli]